MDANQVQRVGQDALLLVLTLSAPAVLAALAVGLLVSLVQAATQLQEQTLANVPKIIATYAALLAFGAWLLRELTVFTVHLLAMLATV